MKEKGITLIALVITIIVLLILAGITISLTIGNQGVITRAQQASKNYKDAEEQEQDELNKFDGEVEEILEEIGNPSKEQDSNVDQGEEEPDNPPSPDEPDTPDGPDESDPNHPTDTPDQP